MDRKKRRGDLPCQRMESSIQRMPANFTVITQNCFWIDLPVAFSPGPQEYRWFSVLTAISHVSGNYENQQGSEFQGPGLETTAANTFWFSLNSVPGFPWLPYFNYNFAICCICWGPVILASQTCQYYHSISVYTLDEAKNGFKYSNHSRRCWLTVEILLFICVYQSKSWSILSRMDSCLADRKSVV